MARDPLVGNIDFFRRFSKQLVDSRVGPIWAPNFYYRANTVQLLFLAPLSRLRRMLPEPFRPLRALPGHGLVALTFFHYALCDNDPYNEVSVAVVIRRPGAGGLHLAELLASMQSDSLHAHVLALPVDTEIARVRGVHGYQLPKWLAPIELGIDGAVRASVGRADGTPDLTLTAPLPAMKQVAPQSRIGTSTMINRIDGCWHQTSVLTNKLCLGQRLFPRDVTLIRASGPLSQLLDGLGASRMLRLDVVKDCQIVLNLPVPLEDRGRV